MSEFTNEQLIEILREHVPEIFFTKDIERLSGGNINYVWRAKGKKNNVIIKHAPPHIASSPEVPLNDSRIDFEARALKLLNEGGKLDEIAGEKVRPPKLYAYDKEYSLIFMEDVGDFQELGEALGSPQKIGKRLGKFIGSLHSLTFQDEELGSVFHNVEIQKVRSQLQYQPAWEYADAGDEKLSNQIKIRSQDLGNRLLEKGCCLVMGDLWPPSVFVGADEQIRLIDWEFVHYGRPLQDVGHFAAHCWMQAFLEEAIQKTQRWDTLWQSFLKAYKDQLADLYNQIFNEKELEDIGIHIGTEILIRSFGPFKDGYIFESYKENDQVFKSIKDKALEFILKSEVTKEEFGF